jgi:ABC-type nitrate/sulfonate/bicarbonate transport system permease component
MLAPSSPLTAARTTTAARAIQVALAVVFFGAWTLVTQLHLVNPLFLPSIPVIANSLVHLVGTPAFWRAVGVTALTTAEAFVIAAVAGIAVGFFIGRSPKLTDAFRPVLSGVFAVPIILIFPLFAVMFGIGPGSKIAFGAVYGFFPIALNTIAGFGNIDPLFVRAARSLGASRAQQLRRIYLPGALPVVLSGLRIGFFITFASVLGGETLSAPSGVGHAIAQQAELLDSGPMFAWIVVVMVATIALNMTVAAVEQRASRH